MSLPWLTQPVMLHSSRDAGTCSMTPEQCALKTGYWVFWYEADHRYGLPTVALFLAVILFVAVGGFAATYAPKSLRRRPLWSRLVSLGRLMAYKNWRLGSWNSQSLGTYVLGVIGAVFFFAMTLGPQPYYWPNTRKISFGNSPPIATRAGYMALACMPFLFVLGAKANPVSALTGISHEKLNIWHNWVAWAMFVLALVHTFPFIVFHVWKGDIVMQWNDGGTWVTGVVALLAQAWLTIMSIRWIRDRYYEFFKATHLLAAAVFFVFFFIHCDFRLTSWDYFIATAVLYSLCFFYAQTRTFMEHGVRRARLSLITPSCLMVVVETDTRWTPGQHVYLRFLTAGVHALTAHPFTICSVPRRGEKSEMVFYVQPRKGVTGRLAGIAAKAPGVSVPVLLDGPYGGVTARWFSGFDRTLVVAGGAGAGFSLPIIEHFLQSSRNNKSESEMTVVIATRDPNFREWYCEALESAVVRQQNASDTKSPRVSIHYHETECSVSNDSGSSEPGTSIKAPTKTVEKEPGAEDADCWVSDSGSVSLRRAAGRPDILSLARRTMENEGSVGVLACGPAPMVFDVGRAAAEGQRRILSGGRGASEVWFYKESFSY
ncbi:Putative ferric reductase, NAD binding domain, ferric reductase transmembrane component-like protein [Colletotrichum destructivum]|uniref:ferric-chelate reductase (NADPH) n=1 Tax=Colletotrichum destructivum TaxID=34406 RepID=A0AAX4ICI5_9PEZI|nr:Putative ferric reductase, NAD binding domain, ferric reductase transmembrane component-like protein [Colletotrichum destructivum]